MELTDLQKVNSELQEKKERAENFDYKMVTFSLAGKDYGVNIMNVKEIAKADKFTYVPNAASFVRGVYNLRGDIIPIIDLRNFFHLPIDRSLTKDGMENMLILHIDERVYGTIVDKIDKVVSIASTTIQPAHPIFGDINLKYISGVVEKQGDLYIILDVLRIFSQTQKEDKSPRKQVMDDGAYKGPAQTVAASEGENASAANAPKPPASIASDTNLGFIKDALQALKKFFPSKINDAWILSRLGEWSLEHSASDIQLKNAVDAEEYLNPFFSQCSGKFWNDMYAASIKAQLPDLSSNSIQVWNPGCGKGYETFSLACLLKLRYPQGHIKIWANDADIMAIANAPNMSFEIETVPQYMRDFMVKGRSGYGFNSTIKDSIVFEYHDITNANALPELDIIVCRDTLSFIAPEGQEKVLSEMQEKLKSKGIVILGDHEKLGEPFTYFGKEGISLYGKQ